MIGRLATPAGALLVALLLEGCSSGGPGANGKERGAGPDAGSSRCGDHPWCDTTLDPAARAQRLLAAMTLQQKIGLMAGDISTGEPATGTVLGIPELELPPLYMSDGPMGPREGQATAFPSPLALAASFDPRLAYRVGQAIANEVHNKGNDLIHAPTVDVMRMPLAGRTFETYGEDPYLSSRLSAPWVQGVQSQGVIANVKHLAVNTQEGQVGVKPFFSLIGSRNLINARVGERTLRELYLPPFESAVKEGGAGSVMCAYNAVNDAPSCGSRHLLQQVLREDWGFDGFVVSDYVLATKDTVQSALAGTDIEMPFAVFYTPLLLELAVLTGQLPAAVIDTRVGNVLRTLFRHGFFDRAAFPSDESLIDRDAHAAVARENLERGIVLLKNDGTLPLGAATRSIAVIGVVAETYVNGGGSSAVAPYELKAARQAIVDRAGPAVSVSYDDGSNPTEAAALAATVDVAIVFVRDHATEGTDKTCLSLDCGPLPGVAGPTPQDDLIRAVAAANPRSVVVMETGGPVLTPWRDAVAALLEAWYPGQEAGPALARVLFGDVDAGGRLPLTFMAAEGDTPVAGNPSQYPGIANVAEYPEGLLTGYRWHDAHAVAPAYPFGHGLSYTQFRYSDLQISAGEIRATLTNIGERTGTEVAQLYIGLPEPSPAVPQPPRQLKGFQRVRLAPGESTTLRFPLDARALSYWDVGSRDWRIAPGCYAISVGASSRDLPLQGELAAGGGSC
ncbi:MAG TPA: glycoside hydrolase family 3 C-terminal domain-containing protein [Solimonas sp.]|nr:glycoside hydrolase family 3 C-terminal domain-containing protein [Solimonas sp.]